MTETASHEPAAPVAAGPATKDDIAALADQLSALTAAVSDLAAFVQAQGRQVSAVASVVEQLGSINPQDLMGTFARLMG